MIHAKSLYEAKKGSSFRKAKGKGFVTLKAESSLAPSGSARVIFHVVVGSRTAEKCQVSRGPVVHDFSERCVASLPKSRDGKIGYDVWDFAASVDKEDNDFIVMLEIGTSVATDA